MILKKEDMRVRVGFKTELMVGSLTMLICFVYIIDVIHCKYIPKQYSNKISTLTFWRAEGKSFFKKVKTFGQTSGLCIMIICFPIQHFQ
jgi:hypothetical protein